MKKIFVDNSHEYDYEVKSISAGTKHILYYANSECWSSNIRNQEVLSVIDTGNGFLFSKKFSKNIDYSDAFSLSILLKIISFNNHVVQITGDVIML